MWEDEYAKDEYIEELVIAGRKSYTHRTSKSNVVCNQKGSTFDRANETLVISFSLKNSVLNLKIKTPPPPDSNSHGTSTPRM